MKGSKRKLRDPAKRAAHYRCVKARTDRMARRHRALLERDAERNAAGPLGDCHALPLASQPVQPQAER
jgi:hypothetical protein